jgi:hypothetical protein
MGRDHWGVSSFLLALFIGGPLIIFFARWVAVLFSDALRDAFAAAGQSVMNPHIFTSVVVALAVMLDGCSHESPVMRQAREQWACSPTTSARPSVSASPTVGAR